MNSPTICMANMLTIRDMFIEGANYIERQPGFDPTIVGRMRGLAEFITETLIYRAPPVVINGIEPEKVSA